MIEILLLRALVKAIGRMLRGKGRNAVLLQFLAVLLWIGGEVTGFLVGFSMEMGNGAYVLALLGAATGAMISWVIASSLKPVTHVSAAVGQIFE